MNFSQYAGVAIVPTLGRLVLAGVFILAGYNKVFVSAEFEATADGKGAANTLHNLDVGLTPKAPPPVITRSARTNGDWTIARASLRQETQPPTDPPSDVPPTDVPPTAGETASPATPPAAEPTAPVTPPASAPPVVIGRAPLMPGTYTAAGLHQITVMLHDRNWPLPVVQAWLAALTELVGGALLLIGLFSRVWGLGLAIVMVVAFYLASLPVLRQTSLLDIPQEQSTGIFFQFALFVLAIGIFMTGPGPLSLDRFLFERKQISPPIEKRPHAH